MANFNKVFLMGNLTRDIELTYTPSNTAVAKLGMAVNRRWKGQDGQQREETTFVDMTMFGRRAEVLNQYLGKGDPLFVEGRLRYETWEGKDGQKRSRLSVVIEDFQFMGRGGGGGGGPRGGSRPQQQQGDSQPPPAPDDYGVDEIPGGDDDDIPF
jgi:single-strand DNA-binding protein